jgi:peptide/nickel transport system substrate-binding protein
MPLPRLGRLTLILPIVLSAASLQAKELRVGLAAEPSSADPHFHNLGPNNQLRRNIFQSLVAADAQQRIFPELATSWRPVSPTSWEFKLRKGVTFSDGSPFDAYDVIYSVCRIPGVKDSPSLFTTYTKAAERFEVPDPHTLIVHTKGPYPLLPVEFSSWGIISAKANGVDGKSIRFTKEGCGNIPYPGSAAFNEGKAAIGTGPYLLESFRRGEGVRLKRNPRYWGNPATWDTVVLRPLTSDGPRVAALLAGDVDLIENPPLQDLARIKAQKNMKVVQGISNRAIYIALSSGLESVAGIAGTGGKNPLKDVRVREALSIAINRDAIVARIMGGVAVAAGELLPGGMFGAHPEGQMKPPAHDIERARKLLADAGYPNGFTITLGTPNDRYINDEQVAQAVAQMWTRIGVKTQVDAMTASTFFSRRNKKEFAAYLAGWGATTGEMSSPLKALVATEDKSRGFGATNPTGYSNKAMDDLLVKALGTVDDAQREDMLRQASRMAMQDWAIIPLHFEVTPWAMNSKVDYKARVDQYTLPNEVRPVP